MANEAIRTFKQFIKLKVTFDEPRNPIEVWPILYEHDIGLKSISDKDFHFNNFSGNYTKKMYRIKSLLSSKPIDIEPAMWQTGMRALLNNVCGGQRNWTKEEITVPRESVTVFKPYYFGFRNRVFHGQEELGSWYSGDEAEFFHDLRYVPDGSSKIDCANIYAFYAEPDYVKGSGGSRLEALTFKISISTKNQHLLDGCEGLINDLLLGTIVSACSEVGSITHSLSCAGEIEVEKEVSCNRFTIPEESAGDEEE